MPITIIRKWEVSIRPCEFVNFARLLGIETADCLTVLLVDPCRRAVAAVHAGWRGTALAVTRAAVEALAKGGSRAADLLAALGPGIGPCCYQVGDDVKAAFGPAGAAFFKPTPRGRDHLDVRAANRQQLIEAGLDGSRIGGVDECTFGRSDLYHSYRRDGPRSGRMISFVGFSTNPSATALGSSELFGTPSGRCLEFGAEPAATPASKPSRPAPG